MTHGRLYHRTAASGAVTRARALLCSCGFGLISTYALSQAPARFPVTSVPILSAIRDRLWSVDGVQVKMMASMTATVAMPVLEIQTVSLTAPNEARLRLGCRVHAECLPFFAAAVWPANADTKKLPQEMDRPAVNASAIEQAGRLRGQPMLRVGTIATLVMDAQRIEIRMQVVSLESGGPGDKVRVTTIDHKHSYVAEIVTPTVLKGSL